MPLSKDKMREYQAKRRAKVDKEGLQASRVEAPKLVNHAPTVNPDVNPTQADVDSGKAWQVLAGPLRGTIRWHGPLAQKWRNVPCEIVAGVCMTEHAPGSVTPHESHDYRYDTRKLESLLGRLNVRLGVEDA